MKDEMKFEFVKIGLEHLDGILRVQERAYNSQFHEKAETFVSKIKYSPETCYGVLVENKLVAYGISFPWSKSSSVNLNSSLEENPQKLEVLHIHDISVDPDFRGLGLGESLFLRIAHDAFSFGLGELTLVAVQRSSSYWSKFGFVETDSNVDDYGAGAMKMALQLEFEIDLNVCKPARDSDLDEFHEYMVKSKPYVGSKFEIITRDELKLNFQSPFWFHGVLRNASHELIGTVSLQKHENKFTKIESFYFSPKDDSVHLLNEFWGWLEIPIRIFSSNLVSGNCFNGFDPTSWTNFSNWEFVNGSEERLSRRSDQE